MNQQVILTRDEMLEVAINTLERIDHPYITALITAGVAAGIKGDENFGAKNAILMGLGTIVNAKPMQFMNDTLRLNIALKAATMKKEAEQSNKV